MEAHLPLANRDIEANKMTKKRFAREIEASLSKYADIKLTPEEALLVGNELKEIAHGSVARTPMTCFPPGALVTMADLTVKPIEEVVPGDEIISHTGNKRRVIRKFSKEYIGNVIRVFPNKRSGQSSAWMTEDHSVFAYSSKFGDAKRHRKDYKYCSVCKKELKTTRLYTRHLKQYSDPLHLDLLRTQAREIKETRDWIRADELQIGDYFSTPKNYSLFKEKKSNIDLAIILGYFLAEGSYGKEKRVTTGKTATYLAFTFNSDEDDLIEELCNSLQNCGWQKIRVYKNLTTHVARVHVRGKKLCNLMMGLVGEYAHKKYLKDISSFTVEELAHIFRTLMLGDGSLSKRDSSGIRITSPKLVWQMYHVSSMLGLMPSLPTLNKKVGRKDTWGFFIDPTQFEKILNVQFSSLKEALPKTDRFIDGDFYWRQIRSIEMKQYEGIVFNLEVEEDHSYLVNGIGVKNCTGSLCPFKDYCVFFQIGKAPVGRDCINEAQLLVHWRMKYMEAYDVDPNDFNELDQINELAEIEIMLARVNMQLKRPGEASLVTEQVIGITPQGKKITEMKLSPYWEAKERLLARKSKIRKLLVGDRQEQYKKQAALKKREDADPSTQSADMKGLLKELQALKKKHDTVESTDGYKVVLTREE